MYWQKIKMKLIKLFGDYGGIKHSAINKDIVDASSDGIETYVVDVANYVESDTTKYYW